MSVAGGALSLHFPSALTAHKIITLYLHASLPFARGADWHSAAMRGVLLID